MSSERMKYTRICDALIFFLLILNACGDDKSTEVALDDARQELSDSAVSFSSSREFVFSSSSSFSTSDGSSSSQENSLISATSKEISKECAFAGKWEFLAVYFNCDSLVVDGTDSIWFGRGRPDYDPELQSFSKELCQSSNPEREKACCLMDYDYAIVQLLREFEFKLDSEFNEYVGYKKDYEGYILKYDNCPPKKDVLDYTIIITNNFSFSSSSSEASSSSFSSSSVSSSSEKISSSSEARSSSVVSSSSYFVIPDSLVNNPRTITLNEIENALKESLYRNLFATDSFQLNYSMYGRTGIISFNQTYFFVSKGRDKLYYQQSMNDEYSKKTRIIINGNRKKVIFLDDGSSSEGEVTQEYIDSVRTEFSEHMVFNNPLDSGQWFEPEQITDSIYRVRNDVGSELYYNAASKQCEMWTETHVLEVSGEEAPADYEFRYEYVDGYVKSQKMNAVAHSTRVGEVKVMLTVSVSNVKSSADFSDEMFEF
jgi:hypothetical protein